MSAFLDIARGRSPLVLSVPHAGTEIPDDVAERLASRDLGRKDTDWWIDRLYAPLAEMLDATLIATRISRTVVDVNRDPSGRSLYPGQATTGLAPLETFDGEPLYRPGQEPTADEVEARAARFFAPYHEALAAELASVRVDHGIALLYDCHSIRSSVPRLFAGELPVFNIGTHGGRSSAPAIEEAAAQACAASGLSWVLNGRFMGGWITRTYGRPEDDVHALQMELAQRAYMDESPPAFREDKAGELRGHLRRALDAMLDAVAALERPL